MLRPAGAGPDRLYPPLVWLLAHGPATLSEIRDAAQGSLEGAAVIDLSAELPSEKPEGPHAG
jgi:hypothetical protein